MIIKSHSTHLFLFSYRLKKWVFFEVLFHPQVQVFYISHSVHYSLQLRKIIINKLVVLKEEMFKKQGTEWSGY